MGMSAYYAGAGSDDSESELVGRAIAGRRDDVVLATKFGLVSHRDGNDAPETVDSSPESVRVAAEGSLRGSTSTCTRRRRTTSGRHTRYPVAALQTEYSLWARDPEPELLPLTAWFL